MKAIVVVSGGMDSVVLAHKLSCEGYDLHVVTFDYGQRHSKEIDHARKCAERLGCDHTIVDLTSVGALLTGSSLTDDIPVPHGHYADENMRMTVVPNRNAIMLSVAYGVAVAQKAKIVAIAVHAGDHPVYPDCRPGFIAKFDAMQRVAVEGHGDPTLSLHAPFVNISKAKIVELGNELGVPFTETWSCYEGGERHCGECGTCVERKEAFMLAGVKDPTKYKGL